MLRSKHLLCVHMRNEEGDGLLTTAKVGKQCCVAGNAVYVIAKGNKLLQLIKLKLLLLPLLPFSLLRNNNSGSSG